MEPTLVFVMLGFSHPPFLSMVPITPTISNLSAADAIDQTSPARLADLPAAAVRRVRRAERWLKRAEPLFAERALAEALALAPDHPELLRMRALILHDQQRYADAIAVLRKAVAIRPEDPQLHNNLGCALGAAGDLHAASTAFENACVLNPEQATCWFNLGNAHDVLHNTERAEQALARAIACSPNHIEAIMLHAGTLKTMGRLNEAIDGFRHALALQPDSIEAWTGLIGLNAIQPGTNEAAALERMYRQTDISAERRASVGFVYGSVLEASGHHAAAFDVYMDANATQRRRVQWDADGFTCIVTAILDAFAGKVATAPSSTLGSEVIFLFGMPRSGSTLAEQILSTHAEVEGAGEIGDLPAVLRDESTRRGVDFPAWVDDATPMDWARLGQKYLQRATLKRHNKTHRFTDKTLSNWQLVGAARAMLPGAHFVDCRRDPVESCWSCFKHQFGDSQPFTFDFTELADWWHDYTRSVEFWNQRYSGFVYVHDYETLIAAPETQIRQLLEHCCLAFDPACLRFHESSRDVRTASAAQVRQPLCSDTARSRDYGALLNPLRAALGLRLQSTPATSPESEHP